jgi:hypothetical protein
VAARPLLFVLGVRRQAAEVASLRRLRVGGWDAAPVVAIAVTVILAAPQLGRDIDGAPFWAAWLGVAAALSGAIRLAAAVRPPRDASVGRSPAGEHAAVSFSFRRLAPLELALVAAVLGSWLVYDTLLWQQGGHLYDLGAYLGSSDRWLHGGPAYLDHVLTAWPSNAAADYFLYAPPLLPLFAALSQLPYPAVAVGWTVFGLACWYAGLRTVGLPRVLAFAMLAFPPLMIGVESGNVAGLVFMLFAAAYRAGGSLVLDGLFKAQAGVPVLWLVRDRRWRGLLAGSAALAAIILVTLPIVGLDAWRAWWEGLSNRAASQPIVESLYGYSSARELPAGVFLAVAAALTLLALCFGRRRGLAAIGLATISASPSLWPHGFLFALPAVLLLESGAAAWLVLGAGAFGSNMWLLFYAGWVAVVADPRPPAGALHPLSGTVGPWPHHHSPPAGRQWPRTEPGPVRTPGSAPTAGE